MKKLLAMTGLALALTPSAQAGLFSNLACRLTGEVPTPLGTAHNLNPHVVELAMKAYSCAQAYGYHDPKKIITIIDYTLPSTNKRLWVVDIAHKEVLFNTLVAQGKYTGGLLAHYFSDRPESKQSSIGLFLTENTYEGHKGYSLRLKGLEPGFNDNAESRDIVVHGAWYVSEAFARRLGRIGLSWGCPAVPVNKARPIINTIKEGTFVFSYYPNPKWLATSRFLHCAAPALKE